MTSATTVGAVIARCRAAGVAVSVRGADLWLTPAAQVTPELTAAVRTFKPRLIAWLTWDRAGAERALDAVLRRIGRLSTAIPDDTTFWSDLGRVDREEAVNVAFARRDRQALGAAIAELEQYCVAAYAPTPPGRPVRPGGPLRERGRHR